MVREVIGPQEVLRQAMFARQIEPRLVFLKAGKAVGLVGFALFGK